MDLNRISESPILREYMERLVIDLLTAYSKVGLNELKLQNLKVGDDAVANDGGKFLQGKIEKFTTTDPLEIDESDK